MTLTLTLTLPPCRWLHDKNASEEERRQSEAKAAEEQRRRELEEVWSGTSRHVWGTSRHV